MDAGSLLGSRGPQDDASWLPRARTRTMALASVSSTLCVLVMIEWYARSEIFVRPGSTAGAMVFLTALSLLAVGGALLTGHAMVRRGLAVLALVVGLLVTSEYLLDVSLGIDQLFVRDWMTPSASNPPGRPAETSVICITMLAAGVLLLEVRWHRFCQLVAVVPLTIAMATGFGYLFGVDGLYHVGPYSMLPATTVVVVLALSLALLLAVPYGAAQWISYGNDTGADLQRILIPLTVVVLPWVGWLVLRGERAGWFGSAFGTTMLISVIVSLVLVVGFWVGTHSLGLDREREELLGEIHKVNQDLEERVRSRSHQLNRQRTKLALLEERDRIARDLHDRVIQRIFAAGLQVGAMSRTAGKVPAGGGPVDPDRAALAGQLDVVAAELDLAIRELRNSIFELTSVDDHDDVDQVVRDIVARASRILGFMPSVVVTGELSGLRADLVANLASVIQEALSNIARHARASSVQVALNATRHQVRLRIADDGVGLPDPLPRSSGISNLTNRARNLGGSAAWEPNEPRGTVLVWQVPRDAVPAADAEVEDAEVADVVPEDVAEAQADVRA